ncbi:DUF1657 domain-containing protein [Jeotgalibacillus soli]|uniref:DUF1657 domain-containing protein n=1 Tax=Jeotgalibacillus soli TaxID=889306 RepID=A0A0C2RDF4_9BACL|nr:DUF1657 domain-containing protein [Jeotgalibacillus soli]KIL48305.1 hypothetical protein KP78_17520 [Jeotgalibacillus soli]
MTVASDVKQSLASLKGIEASLSSLAIRAQDEKSKKAFHESMVTVNEIVEDLKQQVGKLEREEFEYKGF